jgi:cytosine/adenosine deaminase-related metal-dependent hydrolase
VTRRALRGRIATMNAASEVIAGATLYLDGDSIAAVARPGAPVPAGFEGVAVVDTGGTIFPGLIELHNHLAYNTIGLWQVTGKFGDRDKWRDAPAYVDGLKRPSQVLAAHDQLLGAITRYVECKCLVGGVTTTQGIRLNGAASIGGYFRGLVRNVEAPLDAALNAAMTRIPDVTAREVGEFRGALTRHACCLLHLSEGTDEHAHQAFFALSTAAPPAIMKSLVGIHCVVLNNADFKAMGASGAKMVWSPLSNLLLYGDTANVKAARDNGVTIGLGSDWTFSGSKNLLGELKVARAVNAIRNYGFSDRDLVAMATCDGAKVLSWDHRVGSLERGKLADVIVIDGAAGDPYAALLEATEHGVVLSVIGGEPRYGTSALMKQLGADQGDIDETTIAGRKRILSFTSDPNSKQRVSFDDARAALAEALRDLPKLEREANKPVASRSAFAAREAPRRVTLALDEVEETGLSMRPNLPYRGALAGPMLVRASAARAKPKPPLQPQQLDPVSFVDDGEYIDIISRQPNLTDELKDALYAGYGRKPSAKPAPVARKPIAVARKRRASARPSP